MSRQKQLRVVFDLANAQKQGVMGVRHALASSTTMFQESVRNAEFRIISEKEDKMDIDLILKVAGVGMIITVICQVMSKAGKEEQSGMVSLAGTVIILILIAERVGDLVTTLRNVFGL